MLDSIRSVIPESSRAAWYSVAGAVVSALVAWGILDSAVAPGLAGVVTAAVTLLFAIIHSTSPWRQALYALAGAAAVLAVVLGHGTEEQWQAVLAIVAPVLGIGVAASTTNVEADGPTYGN